MTAPPHPVDDDVTTEPGWRRVGPLLDRGWDRLAGLSGPMFLALMAAMAILRSGMRTWVEQPTLDLVTAFPDPLPDWRANSPLGVVLAAAVGADDVDGWVRLHAVALVVAGLALVLGVLAGVAPGAPRRVAAVWLAIGSLPVVLLQKVGSYDAFALIGVVLVVLPRRRGLAVLGGLVLGWTSPEQGAVGLVSAGLVLLALESEGSGRGAIARARSHPLAGCLAAGLAGVVVARVSVIVWFRASGVDVPGRDDLLTDLAAESVRRAVGAGGAGVFTWLGLGWALVVLVALVGRWRARPLAGLLAGLVVLPGAATILTLDGTRVFTMVSLPAVLVLLGWLAPRADADAPDRPGAALIRRVTVVAFVVAPLVPALVVDTTGALSFPFPWAVSP
jgi:hypothetical protein